MDGVEEVVLSLLGVLRVLFSLLLFRTLLDLDVVDRTASELASEPVSSSS